MIMMLVEDNHGASTFSNHVKLIFILLLIYMQQNNMISENTNDWDQYVIIDIENNINNNVISIINTPPSLTFNNDYSYCSLLDLENDEYSIMPTTAIYNYSPFINTILYLYKLFTN